MTGLSREILAPRRQRLFWLGWSILATTLVCGAVLGFSAASMWDVNSWFIAAGGCLVASGAHYVSLGCGRNANRSEFYISLICGLLLVATWAEFWSEDLRHARFALVLLILPTAGFVSMTAIAALHQFRITVGALFSAFVVGMIFGLAVVWVLLCIRESNTGCVGVSIIYTVVQLVTMLVLYLFGPAIARRHLQRMFGPSGGGALR